MTAPDLDVLESLLAKATPGPWRGCAASVTPMHGLFAETKRENSALIVAAVNALPDLLAYVRELERDREAAALAMRERCAQACEKMVDAEYRTGKVDHNEQGWTQACAAAVRALEV